MNKNTVFFRYIIWYFRNMNRVIVDNLNEEVDNPVPNAVYQSGHNDLPKEPQEDFPTPVPGDTQAAAVAKIRVRTDLGPDVTPNAQTELENRGHTSGAVSKKRVRNDLVPKVAPNPGKIVSKLFLVRSIFWSYLNRNTLTV